MQHSMHMGLRGCGSRDETRLRRAENCRVFLPPGLQQNYLEVRETSGDLFDQMLGATSINCLAVDD